MSLDSLVNKAKDVLTGKDSSQGAKISSDNRMDVTDQCKVIWYQWENQTDTPAIFTGIGPQLPPILPPPPAKDLAKARAYDISNHISDFSYSKNMGNAAGTFSFTLYNSVDWSRLLRPGNWITMYLSHDGDLPLPKEVAVNQNRTANLEEAARVAASSVLGVNSIAAPSQIPPAPEASVMRAILPKLRMVGIIQRVGIRSSVNGEGTVDVTYQVTGKDFGLVYEDTSLWFNANDAQSTTFTNMLESITKNFERNLALLLDKYHSVFMQTRKFLGGGIGNLDFFPEQWIVPLPLLEHLSLEVEDEPYFGNIKNLTSFSPTAFENNKANPMAGMQGQAWNKLKELSVPEFHELFTELSDDFKPVLIHRPIPWAMDKSDYPVIGENVMLFEELLVNDKKFIGPELPTGELSLGSILSLKPPIEMPSRNSIKAMTPPKPSRSTHSLSVTSVEVESYDIGPDFHNRYNLFLIQDDGSGGSNLNPSAIVGRITPKGAPFPFRDEADIRRHGFKPMILAINTFLLSTASKFASVYPSGADKGFMIEANAVMRDYHARAEDFYSGSMSIIGKNDVRLGKALETEGTLPGIGDMVFYIEGYTDNFSVNGDGTTAWSQTLQLTRGIAYETLINKGVGSKLKKPIEKLGSFHVNETAATGDALSSIKSKIKKPF